MKELHLNMILVIQELTLELIQSRSLLLDARIAFAKAERDFMISKFELAFQIGNFIFKLY